MTPEAMNIAVAKWMFEIYKKEEGLTPHQRTDSSVLYGGHDSKGLWIYIRKDGSFYGMNYDSREMLEAGELKEFGKYYKFPGDLNAIHSAEAKLPTDPDYRYERELHRLTNGRGERATAPQRCEALLRTVGLWEDKQ
jgi:hypothetical protein